MYVEHRTHRPRCRNVGDDWSCAPENHLPENNVKLFRRIPEGLIHGVTLIFLLLLLLVLRQRSVALPSRY